MSAPVAPTPSVAVEWIEAEGTIAAYVDGDRVAQAKDQGATQDAVIERLRALAESRPEGRVKAVLSHNGQGTGSVIVTADGTVTEANDHAARVIPPVTVEDVPSMSSGSRGQPARLPLRRQRRDRDNRAAGLSRSGRILTIPRPRLRCWLTREGAREDRSSAVIIGVMIVALVVMVGLAGAFLFGGRGSGVDLTRGETLPVPPPREWSAQARWRTPPLLREAGRALVIDGTQVAFVTRDRKVALVDAEAGTVRWSGTYPEGKPATDLTLTTIDGKRSIAAQVGNRLAWWETSGGESHHLDLPDGAVVSMRGTAPLVSTDQGRSAATVRSDRLAVVTVPNGATAQAARDDGTITATGAAGWWHLTPGKTSAVTAWENPTASAPTIVAYVNGSILTLLPGAKASTAQLAVYADRASDIRLQWSGAGYFTDAKADWFPSPSRRWGILGQTLVDLTTGRTTDLGKWSTQLVSSDRALGTLGKERVLVGPQIPFGVLQGDEAFPEDLTLSGEGGRSADALVRSGAGAEETLFLLPPKAGP